MPHRVASSSRVLLPVQSNLVKRDKPGSRALVKKESNNPKISQRVLKPEVKVKEKAIRKPTRSLPVNKDKVLKRAKPLRSIQSISVADLQGVGKKAQSNQMTILEKKSVSSEILVQYEGYLRKLEAFSKENGVTWPLVSAEADAMVADYMDVLFLDKKSPSEGEKVLAALEFFRHDLKGRCHRSRKALKGWRKCMPAQSRLPLPQILMYGMVMRLLYKGFRTMALMTLVAFDLYLRPGEALTLRAKNILPPVRVAGAQFKQMTIVVRDFESGQPDKVGVYDNALRLDNAKTTWMGSHLLSLAKQQNGPEDMIFSFSMEEYRKQFALAGKELGIDQLHPYQLRHGGASQDLSAGLRDHNGVKMRGRWKTDQSVRRYAKIGRVQQLLTKLSAATLQYCQWSEANMQRVFAGIVPPRAH